MVPEPVPHLVKIERQRKKICSILFLKKEIRYLLIYYK